MRIFDTARKIGYYLGMTEKPTNTAEQKAINDYEKLRDNSILKEIKRAELNLARSKFIENLQDPVDVDNFLKIYRLKSSETLQNDKNKKVELAIWNDFQIDMLKIKLSFNYLENLQDNTARLQWIISMCPSIAGIGAMRGKEGGNRVDMVLKKEKE